MIYHFLKKITKNTQNIHKHPYHLVDPSPWPFIISFGIFFFTFGTAMFFHGYTGGKILTFTGFLIIILYYVYYGYEILLEKLFSKDNILRQVQLGLRNGMLLFIFSELLFFISFFWAFFHVIISSNS